MPADTFPQTAPELNTARERPAPVVHDAVTGFSGRVISEGALPTETTQLMAIAAAHIIPCCRPQKFNHACTDTSEYS